jgi:AMP-polyphosphate phosphotransferase
MRGSSGVEAEDFIVSKRPRLGLITKHRKVEFADYERRLVSMQATLQAVQQAYLGSGERPVVVLEGWDTAGKGGVIRRLGWGLDPRSFKFRPFLVWAGPGGAGGSLATTREWRRGYEEINQFERLLVEDGTRIAKIFLHISAGEQIRRFKDRLINPLKRWKLSYEDFRNRERWADYEVAIEDMMERTSTKRAPWYLVPANDKPFGRLAAFTILIAHLGKGLSLEPRPLDPKIAKLAAQLFDLP